MPKTAGTAPKQPLTASSPTEPEASLTTQRTPYVGWLAAAVLGSCATVLLGWAGIGVFVALGWLSMPTLPPAAILETIAQLWLGAHGAPFSVAGMAVGMTPLGLSALIGLAIATVARYAISQRVTDEPLRPRPAMLIAGACTLSYAVAVVLLASLVGAPRQAVDAFVGSLVIAGVGSLAGVRRDLAPMPWPSRLPEAARAVRPGVVAGLLALLAGSLLTLVLAIVSHLERVLLLQASLAPDMIGAALLVVVYLAYAPTILAWSGSYALGAGIQVGTDTLLTPWGSQVGLLPALPLAGAVPSTPPVAGWLLLAIGPVAGVAAGALSVRRLLAQSPEATWRVGAAVGACAGLAAGLVWVVASWFTRGSLGSGRLSELGPRFPELWAYGTVPLLVFGALAGGGWILWRTRQVNATDEPVEDQGHER